MESFEIILPCFNEEDNIIPIFDEITKVVKDLDYKEIARLEAKVYNERCCWDYKKKRISLPIVKRK